jgi:hypothetical protein
VLYFSERYELSVEQVLLRQTALIAPMSLGNALLQVGTAVPYEEGAPSHIQSIVFTIAAVGLAIKAVLYWRFVSIKPARVLFAEQTGTRTW